MITILLAATIVAPGCLEVAVGRGANPHLLVGRRNRESIQAKNARFIANLFSLGIEIRELFPANFARVTGRIITPLT